MGAILLPRTWEQSPTVSNARLNGEWAAAFIPHDGGIVDFTGRAAVANGAVFPTEQGFAVGCYDAVGDQGSAAVRYADGHELGLAAAFSVVASFRRVDNNAGNPGLYRSNHSASGRHMGILQSGNYRPWLRIDNTDVLKPTSGAGFTGSNGLTLVFRYLSGTFADAWWGGKRQHYAATSKVYVHNAGEFLRYIGFQSKPNESIGDLTMFALAHRLIPDDEVAAITVNPWRIFDRPALSFPTAAGLSIPTLSNVTASNLTASTASVAVDLAF